MKPKQVSKCVTRLIYTTEDGIKRVTLKHHSFINEVCSKCGVEVEGIAQLLVDEQKEIKEAKPPFEVGDIVCKDGLFRKEIKIVNRISKTPNGWIMLVDESQRTSAEYIIRRCKLTSTKGWYKI